jgi:hypothetical protein
MNHKEQCLIYDQCPKCDSFGSEAKQAMGIKVVRFSCGLVLVRDLSNNSHYLSGNCASQDDVNCYICGSILSTDRVCNKCEGL